MADATLEIQRLVLRTPGFSREDGQRFADLLVDRLGRVAEATLEPRTLGSLRVRVQAEPGMTPERMADQVVAAVQEALQ